MIKINNFVFKKIANHYCTLAPLTYNHLNELIQAASDGELWNLQYATIPQPDAMKAEIKRRLDLLDKGEMIPFAVIHNKSQKAVGMTTYCKLNLLEKKLDIGWTWYAKSHQRTALNTNCKLLLLTYAFETLGIEEVYFKVHVRNLCSQKAVLRLGANFIGVIKNYRTISAKDPQDYNHYSIISADWQKIKSSLLLHTYSDV